MYTTTACRSASWRPSSPRAVTSCCTPSCEQRGSDAWRAPAAIGTAAPLGACPPPLPTPPPRWGLGYRLRQSLTHCLPAACDCGCRNEYVEALKQLDAVKDGMVGGGQPVELAVELLRCGGRAAARGARWIAQWGSEATAVGLPLAPGLPP